MKKFVFIILSLFLSLSAYAGTTTTNLSLYKPTIDELDWGALINNNFDVIDRSIAALSSDTGLSGDVGVDRTTWETHITSDGSDHSFLDQDVTSGTAPTFTADNLSDGGSNAIVTTTQETNWDNHLVDDGADHSFIDQSVISGATPTFGADNFSDGGSNAIVTTTQETNWDTHLTSDGSDHSFIDQSVIIAGSPTFQDLTISTILTIPVSSDPDVNEVGQIAYDSNDYILRTSADVGQIALAMRIRTIQATILEPDQIDASTTYIFSNETDLVFNIDEIKAWSDTDDVDFTLEEVTFDGTVSSDIEAITISTNGTNIFYTTVASGDIDNATIANNSLIGISFDTSDTSNYIKISLRGWYNADKN